MKTFVWCREEVMMDCEAYIGKISHAHIAIRSIGSLQKPPKCGNPTLRLEFYDLDPAAIARTNAFADDPVRGKELIDGCFTEEHARKIAVFVEKTRRKLFVVNCEAGVSRSPGVVLALRRHYGGDLDEPYKTAHPNAHIASVLGQVLRMRSGKET
jgi:hypothetical protein